MGFSLNMQKVEVHWEQINTRHFIFNFLKTAGFGSRGREGFVTEREKAYTSISRYLQISIVPKITYFVFPADRSVCAQYLSSLAPNQALAGLFMIFSRINQSAGHELTHVFSFYINNSLHYSYKMLSEGLAVWLDQSNKHHHQMARDLMTEEKIVPFDSIIGDRNFNAIDARITYPQCASFVGYLIDNYGFENFKQIWVKEDLKNTIKKVYKKSLEGLEKEWLNFLTAH